MNDSRDDRPERRERLPYRPMRLVRHGTLAELTQGDGNDDGNFPSGSKGDGSGKGTK